MCGLIVFNGSQAQSPVVAETTPAVDGNVVKSECYGVFCTTYNLQAVISHQVFVLMSKSKK